MKSKYKKRMIVEDERSRGGKGTWRGEYGGEDGGDEDDRKLDEQQW